MSDPLAQTYYEILGVDEAASPDEIKKAMRRLVRLHHTDRGGDPETFKAINIANDTLSDPNKRAEYDLFLKHAREDADTEDLFAPPPGTKPKAASTTRTTPPPQPPPSQSQTAGPSPQPPPHSASTPPPTPPTTPGPGTAANPAPANPTGPVPNTRTPRRSVRPLAVAALLVLAFFVGRISSPGGNGSQAAQAVPITNSLGQGGTGTSATQPTAGIAPTAKATPTVSSKQQQIDAALNLVSLKCTQPNLCDNTPNTMAIPVYLYSMDDNLAETLKKLGYIQRWSDNHGQIAEEYTFFKSTPQVPNDDTSGVATNETPRIDINASGFRLNGYWTGAETITWQLLTPQGTLVKQLSYSTTLFDCIYPNVAPACPQNHQSNADAGRYDSTLGMVMNPTPFKLT